MDIIPWNDLGDDLDDGLDEDDPDVDRGVAGSFRPGHLLQKELALERR